MEVLDFCSVDYLDDLVFDYSGYAIKDFEVIYKIISELKNNKKNLFMSDLINNIIKDEFVYTDDALSYIKNNLDVIDEYGFDLTYLSNNCESSSDLFKKIAYTHKYEKYEEYLSTAVAYYLIDINTNLINENINNEEIAEKIGVFVKFSMNEVFNTFEDIEKLNNDFIDMIKELSKEGE